MNLLPCAIAAEAAVVVIHCRPWRKVMRQQPPGAAGSHQIQNTVDHLAYVCCSWPPARFSWWQQRFEQLPLFVCQITGVCFGIHTSVIGQKPTFRTLSKRMSETDSHDAFFAMARKCSELLLDRTGLFLIVEEHQVIIRGSGCKACNLCAAAKIVLLHQPNCL